MNLIARKILSFSIAVLMIVFCVSAGDAWDTSSEVRRLNKEAPSIDGFSGADAVIWLRNNKFAMLADGTMENTREFIVMVGENIPDSLKIMRLPVPSDGSLEIMEAGFYNPMTGLKEGGLRVSDEMLDGGADVKVISVPDNAVGRAVVLITRTKHNKRYGVDETIDMAGALPIWEQNVAVELPEGRQLYWLGRDVKDPVIEKSAGLQRYKWTVINQEPWTGEGFVVYKRPSLSFSFRKGIVQSLASMEETAEKAPSLPLPSFASKSDKTQAGLELMEWIASPSRTLTGYPREWVRSAEQIPEKGPWTPWEQTLILNKWLKKLGWECNVWWQASEELNDSSPTSTSLWVAPVLDLSPTGGKKTLYQAGQVSDFGVTSPSVAGANIYRLNNGEYEKRKIGNGSSSDHRLSLTWLLDLDQNGTAEGTLSINVSGGWTDLMSGGHIQPQNITSVLKNINFAIPGMNLTQTSVVPTKTGYKLEFKVKCAPGIVYGGNLLLRLPGGIPTRVGELIGRESDYTLRFPFIIDQKVRIKMPAGYKILQVPPLKKLGEGTKAILKESITYWPKKAQLIADSTWTVKTCSVDAKLAAVLKEELAACMRWPVLDIPFRK